MRTLLSARQRRALIEAHGLHGQEPMSISTWPRNGFESLIRYQSGFVHLNINLGSVEACKKYHDNWMGRYTKRMADWNELETVTWSIRMRQSLKLAYSATYFALASEVARDDRSLASAYYFSYYAALHAIWSVLYLHPDEAHNSIHDATHSKLANVFRAEFAKGEGSIVNYDAKPFIENLRFLREYYSYRMPLNFPFNDSRDLRSAHSGLGGFVKQSIQLANLHSHLIHKASEKKSVMSASVPPQHIVAVKDLYVAMCGKVHPTLLIRPLDPADEFDLERLVNVGCDLMPHSVMNEHMFDEYMTYSGELQLPAEMIARVRDLVFNAF
jgi:hypothetical protein